MTTVRITREEARKVRLTRAQKARLEAMSDAGITAAAKSDPDNPPLTKAELAKLKRGGRPALPEHGRKKLVTLRLDPDILAHYRGMGAGWQTLINRLLRLAALNNKPDDLLRRLAIKPKRQRQTLDRASEDYAALMGETARLPPSRRGLK